MPLLYSTADVLKLHDLGFWVVPCKDKKAVVKDWPNTRLERDELQKRAQSDPTLSFAIVLSQSHFVDVECDGPEAEAELLALCGGVIPPTPTWQSERGKHRLYLRPEGLPNKAKAYVGGIEVRIANRGALSVVPPSKGRKWLPGMSVFEIDAAPLPDAIAERLRQPESPATTQPTGEGVGEGKRNDTLFQKGCALADLHLPPATITSTLLSLNLELCNPPLPESEVLSIAASVLNAGAKVGPLDQLLSKLELWHDPNGEPFATIQQGEHKEHWRIGKRQKPWRRWLAKQHHEATRSALSESELSETSGLLEGMAIFDGPELPIWRRTAELDGKLYIDLCNDKWQAIEVDEDGWRVVDRPPVKFVRAKAN